jgi:hypothetical protein
MQTCKDWEHIVMLDLLEEHQPVWPELIHPQRKFICCGTNHNNWGNTCRHNAWTHATGDYLYNLDDDNYLADDKVMEEWNTVTAAWAIFPIFKEKFGGFHFFCPPVLGGTDTGSFIVRRTIGRWPDEAGSENPAISSDGRFAEKLRQIHSYDILLTRPLRIYTGRYSGKA